MSPVWPTALALGALAGLTTWLTVGAGRASSGARAQTRLAPGPSADPAVPDWFGRALARVIVDVDPVRAWPVALRAAVVAGGVLAVVAPVPALLAAGLGLGLLQLRARTAPQRQRSAFDPALVPAIDRMAAAIASGVGLGGAIEEAARLPTFVGAELAEVTRRHRQGLGLQAAVDDWAARWSGTGAVLLADALALAGASGGSRRLALEGVAATLRERQALGREVRALGSQARASAVVLVATPIAFSAVVALLDRRVADFLLGGPIGWLCVAAGLALDAIGAWWMHWLLQGVR